jgi:hypothetical protein
MRAPRIVAGVAFCLGIGLAMPVRADDVLHPGTPALDPPTLVALGVVLPITGDDNFTATVSMRYRVTGTTAWHDAMPLQHVHAEAVVGLTVAPQFAGSIFDLAPGTSYDIELHAVDTDGAVDQTLDLTGSTRPVPAHDPMNPHVVAVTDAASLTSALAAAQPGDVITLADGTYAGSFALNTSGTASDPIVIRGTSEEGTILDGGGCPACNILEVYGSYVHLEQLTLAHANRALRFQTAGATDDVVRYVHAKDVVLGFGSQPDQASFYYSDNTLEGRLVWPCVYASLDTNCNGSPAMMGLHANDDGIHVEGNGHVIAYNRISGFGDAMKVEEDGSVSDDFYGNDVLWTYDNAIELDTTVRGGRALRNRFTNTYATLSFQPIYGGPSYAIRNVLVNVVDEQFKLHANGSTPTVGAVILHNTIVRATRAVQCATANAPLYFTVENNLFIGPATLDPDGHVVRWDVPSVSTGTIDYNGLFPDGMFEYGYSPMGTTYANFAAVVAAGGFDQHSQLVGAGVLADGSVGPPDAMTTLQPSNPLLAPASRAIDSALVIPNVNDGFTGAGPDLGALEAGCAAPLYGPRPAGMDESNTSFACNAAGAGDGPISDGDDTGPGGGHSSGCCDGSGAGGSTMLLAVALGALIVRRRRKP